MAEQNGNDWTARYQRERVRLIGALGEVTGGGIVEGIQHVGSTCVPDMSGRPCMDIALLVWPYPLEAQREAALQALGYSAVAENNNAATRRYLHIEGKLQLFIIPGGDPSWMDYKILREYLRQHADMARLYPAAELLAKARYFEDLLPLARAWWIGYQGFAPVEAVARELSDFHQPWYIASGWALDLYLGVPGRVHGDVDVAVAFADQGALQEHLLARGWKLASPFKGRFDPWPLHMRLEMPRHQAHAHRDDDFIDILFTLIENGVWRYRREPNIVQSVERIGLRTATGIPYLAPELALLYKSRNTSSGEDRAKDQGDFERVQARLTPERRAWLRWALLATAPDHAWLPQLA